MGVFISFIQLQAVTIIVNIALIIGSIFLITRKEKFKKLKISPQLLGYIFLIPLIILLIFNLYFCSIMIFDFFQS